MVEGVKMATAKLAFNGSASSLSGDQIILGTEGMFEAIEAKR